jgi:hypothetical protein
MSAEDVLLLEIWAALGAALGVGTVLLQDVVLAIDGGSVLVRVLALSSVELLDGHWVLRVEQFWKVVIRPSVVRVQLDSFRQNAFRCASKVDLGDTCRTLSLRAFLLERLSPFRKGVDIRIALGLLVLLRIHIIDIEKVERVFFLHTVVHTAFHMLVIMSLEVLVATLGA